MRFSCLAAIIATTAALAPSTDRTAHAAARPCLRAAATAEQSLELPAGLLRAIGAVETANQPFSVDVDGRSRHFASNADAMEFVEAADRQGGRYIDVGCFQVDLHYHPHAFAALDLAFDPLANAMAAGRFLLSLHDSTASWPSAVARYHSALAASGQEYAARVFAALDRPTTLDSIGNWPDNVAYGIHIIVPAARQPAAFRQPGLPTVYTP